MGKSKKKIINKPPYKSKTTLTVYLVLRAMIVIALIRGVLLGNYESVFLCVLSLVLMLLPSIVQKRLCITLPSTLEIIILLFIFAAEILGELASFFVRVPNWDTMLHTVNGFLCAAVGFALVDMINRNERFSMKLSPVYLALVAFCFSMTVGVLWEFFELAADNIMGLDMQKDTVIKTINSVALDPTLSNKVIHIRDISDVIIVHSDGTQEALGLGGYLDIGLYDTMKDLLVNFVGAVVFSVIGYFYVKHEGKGKFASNFIPQVPMNEETKKQEEKN
jgi:hypothetical protein